MWIEKSNIRRVRETVAKEYPGRFTFVARGISKSMEAMFEGPNEIFSVTNPDFHLIFMVDEKYVPLVIEIMTKAGLDKCCKIYLH